MKQTFHLLYDECLSRPIAEAMRPLLAQAGIELELKGIVSEFQVQGTPDKVWIPRIAAEGKWVVLTSDRGSNKKSEPVEEKLPYLCRVHRVTHIILSAKVHALNAFEKSQAIVSVWREILTTGDSLRGTRFKLRKNDRGPGFYLFNDDTGKRVVMSAATSSEDASNNP